MAVTMDLRMPSEATQLYEPLNQELGVHQGKLPDGLIQNRLLPALTKLAGEQASRIQPIFGQLHNDLHR